MNQAEDKFEVFVEGSNNVTTYVKFGYIQISLNQITTVNRLKGPFQSNCSNGEDGLNVFPPPYTRQKCQDTLLFYRMLANCSDVPDHWQQYVLPHHKRELNDHGRNQTHLDTLECISKHFENYQYHFIRREHMKITECPLPCSEIITESVLEQQHNISDPGILGIRIVIPSMRITEVQEIATYSLDNFFADLGSWLGLLVGMSFLSLVEIVAFLYTILLEKSC